MTTDRCPITATSGPPNLEGVPDEATVVFWLPDPVYTHASHAPYGPYFRLACELRNVRWFKENPDVILYHVGPILPPTGKEGE